MRKLEIKEASGKKFVAIEIDEDEFYLVICTNGFQPHCIAVDDEILGLLEKVIAEYKKLIQ